MLEAIMSSAAWKCFRLLIISSYAILSFATPHGVVFAQDGQTEDEVVTAQDSSSGDVDRKILIDTHSSEQPAINDDSNQLKSISTESLLQQSTVALTEQAPVITPPPEPPQPTSPIIITAYKSTGAHLNALQLYNNSASMIRLSSWSLSYVANNDEYEIPLGDGWILPRSYIALGWEGESKDRDIVFSFTSVSGKLGKIVLQSDSYASNEVQPAAEYNGALLHRYKSAAGNYTSNTTFSEGAATIHGGGLYTLPAQPGIVVREVLVQPRDCIVGDKNPDCYDFIKVRNTQNKPLDLSLYRLRSGYSNTNAISSNTSYLNDILQPGETKTLHFDRDGNRIAFSANDGTIWLEDIYGLQSFQLGVPPYVNSDLASNKGKSWAVDDTDGQWKWALPSPEFVENRFYGGSGTVAAHTPTMLKPCRDDQYRSEETNRCRVISMTASSLKPCKEGQYRSEETNRCRSIASTVANVLKPCADDQFRNPASGRCKKIASSEELADCGEGRERNPATNRCRNVLGASITKADFAPKQIALSSSTMIGWIVFVLIAIAAAAYAIWEWRHELAEFFKRLKLKK